MEIPPKTDRLLAQTNSLCYKRAACVSPIFKRFIILVDYMFIATASISDKKDLGKAPLAEHRRK